MEPYKIIVNDKDVMLVALRSISQKDIAIIDIKNHIKDSAFTGAVIFDYLLFCSSIESIERFIGFMVSDGYINFDQPYIFSDRFSKYKEVANNYFSKANEEILKYSMLNNEEKIKIIKYKKWFKTPDSGVFLL